MPFKSKKQFQYLRINEPEVFKKFRSEDKREFKDLPEESKISEMPYITPKGKDFDLEFENRDNDEIINYIALILKGTKFRDKYGNVLQLKTWDDKTNFLDSLKKSSQYKLLINSRFSEKDKELLDIVITKVMYESFNKRSNIKEQVISNGDIIIHSKFGKGMVLSIDDKTYSIPMATVIFDKYPEDKIYRPLSELKLYNSLKEIEIELGLISKKNLNELLNDEELHSYFANPNNFDKYFQDINDFFSSDNALTINQLNQYLNNLGYGDKTINKSVEILSKSEDEKKSENKKLNGLKESTINVYKNFNRGDRVIGISGEKATVINNPQDDGTVQVEWDNGGKVFFSGDEEIEYYLKKIKESDKGYNSNFVKGEIKQVENSKILNFSDVYGKTEESFLNVIKDKINLIKREMIKEKDGKKLIELKKKLNKIIEDYNITYDDLIKDAEFYAKKYHIDDRYYWDKIESFWDENIDNSGKFLPSYSLDKRKKIYYDFLADLIEEYVDHSTNDIRILGKI